MTKKEQKISSKRYQYYGKEGIVWTKWFPFHGVQEKYQLKPNLKNEYK